MWMAVPHTELVSTLRFMMSTLKEGMEDLLWLNPSRSEKEEDRRLAQDSIVVRRRARLRFLKLRQGRHGLVVPCF